ncbi:uncharacterized protein LOC143509487 [Brachyhypopomus gauderio]|uniref:uncharacterized protein LOC143509487 n=1 Tax=Brachyhypopomus gauderio TaxID=698409 RepID=UPI0040435FA4
MNLQKEMNLPRVLSLREKRVRLQQLEKQIQAECDAAKKVPDTENKACVACAAWTVPKPGPSLESLAEREHRTLCALVAQYNELKYTKWVKEGQLQELHQRTRRLEGNTAPDADGEKCVQLENILENISLKFTEAKKIYSTYLRVREHLQQEGRKMSHGLEKLQTSVFSNYVELSKAAVTAQCVTAVNTTKTEWQSMAARQATKPEVSEAQVEKVQVEKVQVEKVQVEKVQVEKAQVEKAHEVETRVRSEKKGLTAQGTNTEKEQGWTVTQEDLTELTNPPATRGGRHSLAPPTIPQPELKLMEDVDALTEALSCTDLQELETRLVSQNATEKELLSQTARWEQLVEQRQQDLEELQLQHAQLKFSSPSRRCEGLKAGLEEELGGEQERIDQWESRLGKAQAVLQILEQSIDSLYFQMRCLTVKGSPPEASLNAMGKLTEIRAVLACLQSAGLQPVEVGSLDHEKLWDFLVQSAMIEPRNYKYVGSPVHSSASKDTLQEKDCLLSRDEIKHRGNQVIEAHQPKKRVQKGYKKN